MSPAAEILLIATVESERVLDLNPDGLDLPTPCEAWSVRDVVAHCSGSLLRAVESRLHRFTREDNQKDRGGAEPSPSSTCGRTRPQASSTPSASGCGCTRATCAVLLLSFSSVT